VAALDLKALRGEALNGQETVMTASDTTTPDADEMYEDPAEEATETPEEEAAEEEAEPDEAEQYASITVNPIPVHGVVAPEEKMSGDSRAFAKGAMTKRPLRLPFRDTTSDNGAHNGAFVVGSVDRLMRGDGLIQWEGLLMPSPQTDGLVEKMQFFDGRYGVSVDGDQGSIDQARTKAEDALWFDQVRAAGLTAVDIPAFHEAYVAFGPHPAMPNDDTLAASAYESGDLIGGSRLTFDRGPGWVTDPKATNRIHDYWTKPGQEGYAKIGWGKPGDFARAKSLIGAKIAQHSPDKMRFLNQIIAQWHHDALGYWPATHAKMDREGIKASAETEVSGNRSIEAAEGIEPDAEGQGWEAVLTSSAGTRALPPSSYFDFHPDSGALVIGEPDEFGFRRTYGYAGEWGVCHIGHGGRCVEVPADPAGGSYPDFHLGRTKTSDAGYINTGVITYKVDHRDAQTILSETAEQQHYDNIAHAWCAVRIGEDERGVWFSGVVLPGIPEEDLVVIEAAGQVSGEWKYGSLRAVQAVNVPGFGVLRSSAAYDDEGNVVALVASTFGQTSDCAPTPKEMMAALAKVDAEVRFAQLKKTWGI
jgi:hypothetical protein